ncbi:MAG: DUF1211 domain-containing protein [Chitinophagaceae bacterium]|nr:DUF1211 domain-containing protein [Chitinophagaceae bacterium]
MGKGRLEAFSDGVLVIIITIMVLELKVPHGSSPEDLKPLIPVFFSYVLSFIYLGIYWNNHHHMLHSVHKVNGRILWANMHLLFWLSLTPFTTAWMGENHFETWTVALYGFVLFMAGLAYFILAKSLVRAHGKESLIAQALGKDWKGMLSVILYIVGIGLTFINPWIGFSIYILVAVMWFIPDKRIEKKMYENQPPQ